ncbi:CvpA family protein [Alkalihalobacillus sp. FSL R5-0424]
MLSIIILLMLVFSFFVGRRRGFILQLIHLTGFIISLYVAYRYSGNLADNIQFRLIIPFPEFDGDGIGGMLIQAFNTEDVYYRAIAFAILFFATRIILHIVGTMLDFVAHLPILRTINKLLGGILCIVETYLIVFVLLYVAAVLQIDVVQGFMQDSIVAQFMLNHTPFLSDWIKDLWISQDF